MITVTIVLPEGYANAEEFSKDCGFEIAPCDAKGADKLIEECARIVEHWSLPTIQTPSMWLIDKAGIAAEIRSLSASPPEQPAAYPSAEADEAHADLLRRLAAVSKEEK